MKKVVGVALLLVVAVFLLPFLIHRGMEQEQAADPAAQEEIALPDSGYTLRILGSDGQVTEMDMNQYLWGVVAAEMPASFEEEALKAQAVAARTYALNKGPTSNHPDADLCTDYNCCQAYRPGGRPEQLGGPCRDLHQQDHRRRGGDRQPGHPLRGPAH